MKILRLLIEMVRVKTCRHQFQTKDLKRTDIPIPTKPSRGASWKDCQKWADEAICGNHPSHTHRVEWPCCKCNTLFYGHCGLDILSKYGKHIPPIALI